MSKGLEQFRSHFHSSKGRELRGGHGNKVIGPYIYSFNRTGAQCRLEL